MARAGHGTPALGIGDGSNGGGVWMDGRMDVDGWMAGWLDGSNGAYGDNNGVVDLTEAGILLSYFLIDGRR